MHITLLVLLSVLLWPPAKRVNVALLYEKITKDRPRITVTHDLMKACCTAYMLACVFHLQKDLLMAIPPLCSMRIKTSIKRLLVYSTLMVLLIRATALSGIQHLTL